MKIGLAQINTHVGNISANRDKIVEFIRQGAGRDRLDLIIFPELAITGYPPEDLLLRPDMQRQVEEALMSIAPASHDIGVIVGFPDRTATGLYNACAYLADGRVVEKYYKQTLPNYGVFDEARYFTGASETGRIDVGGVPAALSVCEDIWADESSRALRDLPAAIIININASPYHFGKLDERKKLLKQRVEETGKTIVYVNMVGGQDELVFDGGSLVMDSDGEVVFQAPQFEEGLFSVELEYQPPAVRFPSPAPPAEPLSREQSIYRSVVLGIHDYVTKNGFNGVVMGLSGGIDSALTLCLAVDALGAEAVEALLMPSRYTAGMSVEDSITLCRNLGVRHDLISIEKPFSALLEELAPLFKGLPLDATEENIQSRCRGILLMAVSNKLGKLVLATGNKSELAVGYATLYGDMAGGFAPLKDLSKTMVYRLSRWRNRQQPVIPGRIIDRPPSAELRADQTDADSLPPYDVLDSILELYIERDLSPGEIIRSGFDRETVLRITRLVDRNEYKRRQAAPGVKISKRAFGRDRRYPITSGYREE